VTLVADANRSWNLQHAVAFGRTLAAAAAAAAGGSSGSILAYIEEPTSDPSDMARFYSATGMHLRLQSCHGFTASELCYNVILLVSSR
jgi:L-alanine-DL-glutamate epimerase-like enolase superfamily enzyme